MAGRRHPTRKLPTQKNLTLRQLLRHGPLLRLILGAKPTWGGAVALGIGGRCGTMSAMPRKRHVDAESAVPRAIAVESSSRAIEHSRPSVQPSPGQGRVPELAASRAPYEDAFDAALRPRSFDEYIGQRQIGRAHV